MKRDAATYLKEEAVMARIVKRTYHAPYKLVIGGEEKYFCRCGLSMNQPYCDGSPKMGHKDVPTEK